MVNSEGRGGVQSGKVFFLLFFSSPYLLYNCWFVVFDWWSPWQLPMHMEAVTCAGHSEQISYNSVGFHSQDTSAESLTVQCSAWLFPKQSLKVKNFPKTRKFHIKKISTSMRESWILILVYNFFVIATRYSEPRQPRCYSLVSLNNSRFLVVGSCALFKVPNSLQF